MADLDQDGREDLLQGQQNRLVYTLGTGSAGLDAPLAISAPLNNYEAPRFEDFNEDGRADLIVSGQSKLELRLGLGGGAFGPASTLASESSPCTW